MGAEVVFEGLGAGFRVCVRVVHGGYGVVSHCGRAKEEVWVSVLGILTGYYLVMVNSGQSRIYFPDTIRDSIENAVENQLQRVDDCTYIDLNTLCPMC